LGKLIYLLNTSLDGYVETVDKGLEWSTITEEIHSWFNEELRSVDASIYGRGLYETMSAYWPTAEKDPSATPAMLEFARIWNAKPKIVFSTTLSEVRWNSELVRGDVGDELQKIRTRYSGDIEVGGATLARSFIERGLVDEFRMVVHPVVLGGGTPYFPRLEQPIGLRLVETRQFESGHVYLRYAAA
jgi:dihydrofolate reductase